MTKGLLGSLAALLLLIAASTGPAALGAAVVPERALTESANVGECAWCACCDADCILMLAHTGPPNGISGAQYCDPEMCRIIGDCLIILDPLRAEEEVIPLAVLAQLGGILDADDMGAVLSLLAAYPSQLVVNADRSSLQVKRCGSYVANLPLRVDQLERVISAE